MIDRFEEILKELSEVLGISLHSQNRTCTLSIDDLIELQIELDPINQEQLFIASFISELPPGKFRENVLRESLKENNNYPRIGVLAYNALTNQLLLFSQYSLQSLNGKELAALLNDFLEKVLAWKKAIDSGFSSPPNRIETFTKSRPFGMNP